MTDDKTMSLMWYVLRVQSSREEKIQENLQKRVKSHGLENLFGRMVIPTETVQEIKGGKKTRLLKNPIYTGVTPTFWRGCDAICGESEWVVWGTPRCGKGQPAQTIRTGHGASPARFRNVKVFSRS